MICSVQHYFVPVWGVTVAISMDALDSAPVRDLINLERWSELGAAMDRAELEVPDG